MNTLAVLIPVYRSQAGLERSLASLRDADGQFDIVIVDDGSPFPIAVPPELRDGVSVTLLRKARNGGITRALNSGLEVALARGYRYIARLDAGDTVAPDRFALQERFLEENQRCAAVSSHIRFSDTAGNALFCHRPPTSPQAIWREMRLGNCLLHSGVTFRTAAIILAGGYDESYCGAEDYELFLRLGRQHTLGSLPLVLTTTELDPEGLSVRGRRRQQLRRLRCQLNYFDWLDWWSFLGVARTSLAMLTPHRLVLRWKRFRWDTAAHP
jgi:glycosyltransferase involved in cell wall biosynthesis